MPVGGNERVVNAGNCRGVAPCLRGREPPRRQMRQAAGTIPAPARKRSRHRPSPLPPGDHPHVCGEEAISVDGCSRCAGSSPRLRGGDGRRRRRRDGRGIIPAPAGKGRSATAATTSSRDHPRACGEGTADGRMRRHRSGSSPRMRGRAELLFQQVERLGIIPAHAGKGRRRTGPQRRGSDHPRACGEGTRRAGRRIRTRGSSPRLRGRDLRTGKRPGVRGIIPAPAGKGSPARSTSSCTRDHPRACGEGAVLALRRCDGDGSSPRLRGRATRPQAPDPEPRIIPAPAGKGGGASARTSSPRDHPRACGEGQPSTRRTSSGHGSSPRLRGRGPRRRTRRPTRGIIPAPAGKGRRRPRPGRRSGDHPRACGEGKVGLRAYVDDDGSSPRLRGRADQAGGHPD